MSGARVIQSSEAAEERSQVADQQIGYLHGWEVTAVLELRPVLHSAARIE